ncbi:MAG: acyl carrier protein [Pseudomonadota bacterium]
MSIERAHNEEFDAIDANTDVADIDGELKSIIADVLGLDTDTAAEFTQETGLFGHLPELDSMAVAGLLTEMEDRLGFIIEDDDVDGEMLETYGGLLEFAQSKLAEG